MKENEIIFNLWDSRNPHYWFHGTWKSWSPYFCVGNDLIVITVVSKNWNIYIKVFHIICFSGGIVSELQCAVDDIENLLYTPSKHCSRICDTRKVRGCDVSPNSVRLLYMLNGISFWIGRIYHKRSCINSIVRSKVSMKSVIKKFDILGAPIWVDHDRGCGRSCHSVAEKISKSKTEDKGYLWICSRECANNSP